MSVSDYPRVDIFIRMFLDTASIDDQESTLLTLPTNAASCVSKRSPHLRCSGNLSSYGYLSQFAVNPNHERGTIFLDPKQLQFFYTSVVFRL